MKLNEKALLVNLSIGQWEGRKTDKKSPDMSTPNMAPRPMQGAITSP